MISARGILAIGAAAWFVVMAHDVFGWFDEQPPLFIIVICDLVAALLLWVGLVSLRFVWRRSQAVRSSSPVTAECCILPSRDLDDTMLIANVRMPGAVWRIAVVLNKASDPYSDGVIRKCQAWLHPRTHELLSIAIDGRHMNTLPIPQRITNREFGKADNAG